jgi:hypothetical protein
MAFFVACVAAISVYKKCFPVKNAFDFVAFSNNFMETLLLRDILTVSSLWIVI